MPILDQIGIGNEEDRRRIQKLIRYHSLVHALLHHIRKSNRDEADSSKQSGWLASRGRTIAEYGFDPFDVPFVEAMDKLFGNKEDAKAAVLLSYADDGGKISEIEEDRFTKEFIDSLVSQL